MSESAIDINEFALRLKHGSEKLGVLLSTSETDVLLQFLALLHKWNKTFNLSAVRDPSEMLSRHLLDSLSLLPILQQRRLLNPDSAFTVLDVGTGPGLPGIPLAICMPDTKFVLLDSNGKKTRFVFQACLELGIKNVAVENTRIENYQSTRQVDIVVSRAFASLVDFARGCEAVAGQNTRLLAMKGLFPQQEIADLPPHWKVMRTHELQIPGCDGERHVIELTKHT
ncbi:MAG: 16S rRNA (guanine(527)-N(7))-methyltransferase RsmG [Gammaproteobacteria bacterium]|nr:16S rRNA (guanine(527)-N(7))-methyltransferase RsmG [Gammaproteobacteria bacterium]